MCSQNQDIYLAYKPLRNHLRKCGVYMSLAVIRAYVQNLQFNIPFPSDTEVLPEYLEKDHVQKTRLVSEWKLAALAREVIINSPEDSLASKDFRKWDVFSGAINKVKDIDGAIAEKHLNQGNILSELHRIAHDQFPWQIEGPNRILLTRYFRIFSAPALDPIIRRVVGLDVKTIYLVGVALLGNYLANFATAYPISIDIPGLDRDSVDKFLARFSIDFLSLKERLVEEQDISDKFFYAFSSLRAFPIIRMQYKGAEQLVCPIPTLLLWRYTAGLYYEICGEDGFDNAFGNSFQNYIGDCIQAAHSNEGIKVFPEADFMDGKAKKDSVDWIVDDGAQALFIECKAKRMTLPSKTELYSSEGPMDRDLDKMADAVTQVYKTIRDYTDGKYPHYKFNENKKIYPLVVTLEDWHLFGDNEVLGRKIKERLLLLGIPEGHLFTMPFTICSAQEFEQLIQVIQSKGVDGTVAKKLLDDEKKKWAMTTFLSSEYPQEFKATKPFFPEDYDRIFSPVTGVV